MSNITKIIVHCSATPEGREHNAEDIDRWHRERGFRKIGYHYVIKLDGTIEIGRKGETGAHTKGHNLNSIGICYIGGCDKNMKAKDTRTEKQKNSLLLLLYSLLESHHNAMIFGHRDFANKACPSFDATAEYKDLRKLSRAEVIKKYKSKTV
jgi:N-acetylmuramoyl-L-alanine amidase